MMNKKDKCKYCAIKPECELRKRILAGTANDCINWTEKPWESEQE